MCLAGIKNNDQVKITPVQSAAPHTWNSSIRHNHSHIVDSAWQW